MSNNAYQKKTPFHIQFLSGGLAASIAEVLTIPLDTAKVRLQVQGKVASGTGTHYNGLFDCVRKIAAEEGPLSLFNGLNAGIQR
mmetsp:Transcript_19347/g.16564  ORF Transcript_19347/g.16564 Transcript_19347/m.16564 type:complete len:84 (+) Transcript_19347:61-312(+)